MPDGVTDLCGIALIALSVLSHLFFDRFFHEKKDQRKA